MSYKTKIPTIEQQLQAALAENAALKQKSAKSEQAPKGPATPGTTKTIPTASKSISRAEWSRLSAQQRVDWIRGGGRLHD